MPTTQSRIN